MTKNEALRMARERQIRLVICDGVVESKTDGQQHYVGPMQLMQLYGIPNDVPITFYPSSKYEFLGWRDQPNDIVLRPKFDGDYSFDSVSIQARGQA
jgi:hypothetical protein